MGFFNTPTVISQIKGGKLARRSASPASSARRCCPTCRRSTSGHQGLRGQHLVRLRRAGGHAARRRREAQHRDRPDPRAAGRAGQAAAQGFDLAPPMPPAAFGKIIATTSRSGCRSSRRRARRRTEDEGRASASHGRGLGRKPASRSGVDCAQSTRADDSCLEWTPVVRWRGHARRCGSCAAPSARADEGGEGRVSRWMAGTLT